MTATVQTDEFGRYLFTDLPPGGNYTVTPSSTFYQFTPASSSVNALSGDAVLDFTALFPPEIGGRLVDEYGNPVNATVTLGGDSSQTTQTNYDGRYIFSDLTRGGSYTVTPSSAYYTFSPTSRSVSNITADQTFDFTALQPLSISGRVTVEFGYAAEGVNITLSGTINDTQVTNPSGNYGFFEVPRGGTYTVTPSHPLFTFTPASQTYTNMSAPQELNFTATYKRYSISGRVTDSGGTPVPAVTITLSGSPATQTDANGDYSLTDLIVGGSFIVTPSKQDWTFEPQSFTIPDLRDNQTVNFTGTRQIFTISGRVTDSGGVPVPAVTITLSGSPATQTDANGNYSLTDLVGGGSFIVTPSKQGWTFEPQSYTNPDLRSNQTVNFTGTRQTFTIGGRVTDSVGAALSGVTVTLSGSQTGSAQTDAQGNYSFASLVAEGSYTVTPALANYGFSPSSRSFTNLVANQTADFTGTRLTFSIGGRVTDSGGAAIAGVTMSVSGYQSSSTQTDAQGNFSFAALPAGGDYTVAPSLGNFSFSPSSRSFTNLSSNQTADFTGTRLTFTVSGRVTAGASGLGGVTVALGGGQSATTLTDGAGNYAFASLPAGFNYTLTPAKTHYVFNPTSLNVDNLSANATADFGATLLTHSITGRVVDGGGAAGLAGVSVSLGGSQSGSATTDASGNFAFLSLPAGGNYTVTPSKALYSFTPSSLTFNDLGADQTANFTGSLLTFSIGGRVTEGGAGLGGVAITLSGSQSAATLTDAAGNYAFTGLNAGNNYIVTAGAPYFTFSPASWAFTSLSANQTANFLAARLTYQVSGSVKDSCGVAIAAVTMTLSHDGVYATATTDAAGQYSFSGVQAGFTYSLTPTSTGYTFNPAYASLANLSANQSANFTGTPPTATTAVAPTADAYVRGGSSANSNFGGSTQLITRLASSNSNTYESYLTFDVGQLCSVSSVKLRLFGRLSNTNATNVQVSAFPVASTSWTETGITWNNKPPTGALLATTTVANTTSAWYEWDITAFVRSEITAGRRVVSLALKNPAVSSNQASFSSRQASTNTPRVVVTTP